LTIDLEHEFALLNALDHGILVFLRADVAGKYGDAHESFEKNTHDVNSFHRGITAPWLLIAESPEM
jgi:hypothetical protein